MPVTVPSKPSRGASVMTVSSTGKPRLKRFSSCAETRRIALRHHIAMSRGVSQRAGDEVVCCLAPASIAL